ncbi:MAG: methylmalonyl-CoA mutase family protein [Roseiarcus sp.]|uniref:methylmalonyl-CoA mutase family protein n=1 Tax=Roseiarcus sp. TaxID=1969460 RepID=UPI003BB013B7
MGADAGGFPGWVEADWRKTAEAALKGAGVDTLASRTADGIRIEPIYPPGDGPRPLRTGGPWRVIARLDHPDAGEANAQALDDLAGGADGLQVVFAGAVGAHGFGLRRSDPATLHAAFDGMHFDQGLCFELDLGRAGADAALNFAALIERSGARPADCAVSFGLDPYATSAFGPFPADWTAHLEPFVGAALALRAKGFLGPLVVADSRSVHAAGGAPSQELAFALGAAVGLLRALDAAGVPLDEARQRIAFRLAGDADEFVTLSKFRALRLMWARIEEGCGLEPRPATVQAESAWRMMTARDPTVNVMRGAMAAFSAGLGGADSVSVLPHTLAAGLPDGLARRLARNGQLILLRESHLGFVADPAAGAGAFETLSKALCDKAWSLFQQMEAGGGLAETLAKGAFQHQVAETAAQLRRDVARLKAPITGVSAHADLAEDRIQRTPGAPEREEASAGEGALAPMRLAEPFESLRDRSDAIFEASGSRPKVFLVALGPEPSHRRRVAFMREWLEAGGIESVYDGEAETPDTAVRRLKASGASLACLCGDDAAYATRGEAFAAAIKAAGAKGLSLAGHSSEAEAALRTAGVDGFIFAGGDAVAALQDLYRRLGA